MITPAWVRAMAAYNAEMNRRLTRAAETLDAAARRAEADARIEAWAGRLTPGDLAGDPTWFSGAAGREMRRPR